MPFKNYLSTGLVMIAINLSLYAQTPDSILFPLGTALMLTENHPEAEDCFRTLAADSLEMAALYNNRGINLAMWGLSLLKKDEAHRTIKFIFPFEVAPDLRTKGNENEEDQRIKQISLLLEQAGIQLEKAAGLAPGSAEARLNLAAVQALRGRWQQEEAPLYQALETIDQAELLAPDSSVTQGYRLLIKGIIYDYMDKPARRSECFREAKSRYGKDIQLQVLLERNEAIAAGDSPALASTDGERFDIMEDDPEWIDNVKLSYLIVSGNLQVDEELASLTMAKLYRKQYNASTLYVYFQDVSHFIFIHQTAPGYSGQTGKGIKMGDDKASVIEQYGRPLRIHPSPDGEYLYYKKAKLIFLLDETGKVKQWMVWRSKG